LPEPGLLSHLQVAIHHRIGSLDVSAAFALDGPWTVLFGPSGSGKTTILRVIAGLTKPDHAEITRVDWPGAVNESTVVLDSSAARLHIPPHRRSIGFAGQRASLFPHLSVLRNLQYGLARSGSGTDQQTSEPIRSISELFRITGLEHKYPRELSGGEAQRVNLARACITALATSPQNSRLLLLDEPLTGLDLQLRDAIVADLKTWSRSCRIPVLSVTHDVGEVFQLNAEVIRLREGRIVQRGSAETVLAEERSRLIEQLGGSDWRQSEPYLSG
jgi:molybdate transport system ATP-binding protein